MPGPMSWTLLGLVLGSLQPLPTARAQVPAPAADQSVAAAAFSWTDAVLFPPANHGLVPQRLQAYGRTHYYQLAQNPVGTLVLIHGCGRSAKAFWPFQAACLECKGFPEHMAHTKQGLRRGYHVLALEPNNVQTLCWSSSGSNGYKDDRPDVIETVEQFVKDQRMTSWPIYLLGVSSGATMAMKLIAKLHERAQAADRGQWTLRVAGIIAEESAPLDFGAADDRGRLRFPYPPTIFVGMERGNTIKEAPTNVRFLQSNGVPSAVIKAPIRAVGPYFFSERTPSISWRQSAAMVAAMKQIGLLDGQGYVTGDPEPYIYKRDPASKSYQWESRLKALLPWMQDLSPTLSLVYSNSGIHQALNVAYARHDAVADYTTACLAFLEAGGRADLQDLLRQHTVSKLSALTVQRQYPPGSAPPRSMRVADAGSGAAGGSSTDAGGGNDGVAPQALASVVGVLQQILQMHEG